MSKRTKWLRLAARFAAEKAGMTEQQARIATRNKFAPQLPSAPDYSHQISYTEPLFPLPISVEAAMQLSVIELSGSSRYLPKYEAIPEDFRRMERSAYHNLYYKWFFSGLTPEDLQTMYHRMDIPRDAALRIIRHTMVAMDSSSTEKATGVAYMLLAWFEIRENVDGNS